MPPEFVNGESGSEGRARISASTDGLESILTRAEWEVKSESPGNATVKVSISSCSCELAIEVTLLPVISRALPSVSILTPDERHVFETDKFKWQGSFSHLADGSERKLSPKWLVPSCSNLPTAASWEPCAYFFAPGSPAIYADFDLLAHTPDPVTLFNCESRYDCEDRWTSASRMRGPSGHTNQTRWVLVCVCVCVWLCVCVCVYINRSPCALTCTAPHVTYDVMTQSVRPLSNSSTAGSDDAHRVANATVKRSLAFRVDSASACSDTQRLIVTLSVQNAQVCMCWRLRLARACVYLLARPVVLSCDL